MKLQLRFFRLVLRVLVLASLSLSALHAQHVATLRGKVTAQNGEPIVGANIFIKEIARGDASSEDGSYTIQNIPAGVYTVVASSVGFASLERIVEMSDGQTVEANFVLNEETIELPTIVVTATRNERIITDVPIPTSVISEKQMKAQSAVRLNDILAEQHGMFITYNQFGTGIQIEGLDPAYTLVLVDGEPIIGRTGGTLELTRLTLGNVQRVEIVKGPSSSLYGSDALAAVVNLVSKEPTEPLKFSMKTRYGSNNTFDLNGGIEALQGPVGVSVFIERNSSDGYDLSPATASQTAPPYTNYSVTPKVHIDLAERTKASITGRAVTQNISNSASALEGSTSLDLDDQSTLLDWNIGSTITHHVTSRARIEGRVYHAEYNAASRLTRQTDGSVFDESSFDQTYNKAEAQLNMTWSEAMVSTFGTGYVYETVLADRISGDKHTTSSYFAFAQQEWIPSPAIDLIASFRYDAHRAYTSRVSPKISALVKPLNWLSLRASVGGGFKAPTFQQLYLDFTNPQVGYSVFGSATAQEAFRRLQESGQVESVLLDPNSLETIKPENSLAYSAGLELHLSERLTIKVHGFRNQLQDLIEAAPFAMKTNGQSIFTYFNIHRVFTQGFNAELTVKPFSSVTFSAAYQYLEAKDEDVLNDVRAEKIFKVGSTGRVRPVQESEYGGLFNRSAHSGTVKLSYENRDLGFGAHLRGILRNRTGYADMNGNTILDDDSEYAPGYALWNLTLSQVVLRTVTAQIGLENVFDKTLPTFFPSLPGRVLFASFSYEFH